MERDGFQCMRCESKDRMLHVHHTHYEQGMMPWEYDDDTLVTFCEDCHKEVGDMTRELKRLVGTTWYHGPWIYGFLLAAKSHETSSIPDITDSRVMEGFAKFYDGCYAELMEAYRLAGNKFTQKMNIILSANGPATLLHFVPQLDNLPDREDELREIVFAFRRKQWKERLQKSETASERA